MTRIIIDDLDNNEKEELYNILQLSDNDSELSIDGRKLVYQLKPIAKKRLSFSDDEDKPTARRKHIIQAVDIKKLYPNGMPFLVLDKIVLDSMFTEYYNKKIEINYLFE